MIRPLVFGCVVLASLHVQAQETKPGKRVVPAARLTGMRPAKPIDAATLEARYKKKLGSAFIAKTQWAGDFDIAKKMAKDQRKLIFAYFTRSYSP